MLDSLRYQCKRYFGDMGIIIPLCSALLLLLFSVLYIASNISLYSDATFLHYTVGIGVDLIGTKSKIFVLPLIGLMILIGNTVMSLVCFNHARMVSYFFVFFATSAMSLLCIASLLVVSLNA